MSSPVNRFSIYLPDEMLAEVWAEAARLDRSVSWVVQAAWLAGRESIKLMPAAPTVSNKRAQRAQLNLLKLKRGDR
jgi:uncharacterized small protein (TIGR04563 family)